MKRPFLTIGAGRLMPRSLLLAVAIVVASCQSDEHGARDTPAVAAASPTSAPTIAPDRESQLEDLRRQLEALKAENELLKRTPDQMLAEVRRAIASGEPVPAEEAVRALVAAYPQSSQSAAAQQAITAFNTQREKALHEAARVRALGVMAIDQSPAFVEGPLTLRATSIELTNRWVFDRYPDYYHYREAERGERFIVVSASITSKDKDPQLPGIAAYRPNDGSLVQIATGSYRFQRWADYGTYLGNGHDFRNDFAHTATISFTIGLTVMEDQAKGPLFIVSTRMGCITRTYERFEAPPVSYGGACPSLPTTLSPDDFKSGRFVLLKVLNRPMATNPTTALATRPRAHERAQAPVTKHPAMPPTSANEEPNPLDASGEQLTPCVFTQKMVSDSSVENAHGTTDIFGRDMSHSCHLLSRSRARSRATSSSRANNLSRPFDAVARILGPIPLPTTRA